MNIQDIFFYLISVYVVFTGIMAVTTRKIFRSAIWLLFTLIGIAALYFWMEQEFVAAVQIVVYVGGIVVLIIFSIFLTQQAGNEMPAPLNKRVIPAAGAVLFGIALVLHLIYHHVYPQLSGEVMDTSVNHIGTLMLNSGQGGFVLPFEAISVLLLAAMVGCIVIAMKPKKEEAAI